MCDTWDTRIPMSPKGLWQHLQSNSKVHFCSVPTGQAAMARSGLGLSNSLWDLVQSSPTTLGDTCPISVLQPAQCHTPKATSPKAPCALCHAFLSRNSQLYKGHMPTGGSVLHSASFFWACLVCPAASQAQQGVQQGGHSGDIERCAKLLPSPAWETQICYPRNHLQSSAEGNPGNSVVPAVSKDAHGG